MMDNVCKHIECKINLIKNGVFWVVTPCGSCKNRNPEDTILHSHRRENLKSYKFNKLPQLRYFFKIYISLN
jgi:hypothetical protein